MRTQEEVDAEYYEMKRARREATAERIKVDNAKLGTPKDYRGITYYMNQYGNFIVPDGPKELEGMHTNPARVHQLIDAYLDKQA